MQQPLQRIKRIAMATVASFMLVMPSISIIPLVAYAEDCVTTTAPKGVDTPAGADAGTYTYNSCGYFENEHFTWSPSTHSASPKVEPTYNYNSSTGKCDAQVWHWSPVSNSWFQQTVSVTTPPNGDACVGKPLPQPAPSTSSDPSGTSTSGGSSGINTGSTNDQTITDTNNATLNNTVGSQATSGNAGVIGNVSLDGTTGGATSGNAQAIANVFNLLQSTSSAGSTVATFTANVNGDVQGDLLIDPSMLQPASTSSDLNNNVSVNVANNGSINNNIQLAAQSGDATVEHNINAGDATSGNAQAIANVVNMMNTLVSANQSFLGVININGNLNGNILVPQKFLDSLIASNAPHENVSVSQSTINQLAGNVSNNDSINNTVNSTAQSGSATATNNDNSGTLSSATTGTAGTNVTIFNLANQQISGGNTMLVFVNVLGKWVGVIMDAPAGSTAAALGGGVSATSTANNNANYDVDNNGTITNNIGVSAKSGDATVNKNINAGNAVSGNAQTAVNLANLTNDTVNLTGWFGILFINVFGNWNGNFGVATTVPTSGTDSGSNNALPNVFGFSPTEAGASSSSNAKKTNSSLNTGSSNNSGASFGNTSELTSVVSKVLGATTGTGANKAAAQVADAHSQNMLIIIGGTLVLVGIVLAAGDRRFAKSKA